MRAILLLLAAQQILAAETFRFPAAKVGDRSELRYVAKIPVLTVAGTPDEMGRGVGTLALKPGARVLAYPKDLLRHRKVEILWSFFTGAGKSLYKNFPTDRKRELDAIAKSAGVDIEQVIYGNTFFDLKKIFACSALLVEKDRSATGGTLLARNLDYPSLGYVHQYSLVTIYRPEGKQAFASIGFPGLVGVLSGMNESGLALGVLEVFDSKEGASFNKKGVPYGLCLRQVLEESRTIEEAKKLLEASERTTTINVAIADRSGVAVLEVSPQRVVRRIPSQGVCVTTNHFCSMEQKAKKPVNINRTFERFTTLEKLNQSKDRITIEMLRRKLDSVNLGSLTLQTMVFEPSTLKLWIAFGEVPSSAMQLQQLDLAPLLKPGR